MLRGGRRELSAKGQKEPFRVMEISYMMFVLMVTHV